MTPEPHRAASHRVIATSSTTAADSKRPRSRLHDIRLHRSRRSRNRPESSVLPQSRVLQLCPGVRPCVTASSSSSLSCKAAATPADSGVEKRAFELASAARLLRVPLRPYPGPASPASAPAPAPHRAPIVSCFWQISALASSVHASRSLGDAQASRCEIPRTQILEDRRLAPALAACLAGNMPAGAAVCPANDGRRRISRRAPAVLCKQTR